MNNTISRYIQQNILYPLLIEDIPDKRLSMIVVIPCYNVVDAERSIRSLMACEPPMGAVEILIVIYASREDPDEVKNQNQESYQALNTIDDFPDWMRMYCIMNNEFAPAKASKGMARKIGMDEAVRRFYYMKNPKGIIVSFDADCVCDTNYFVEIENTFSDLTVSSVGIDFEYYATNKESTAHIPYELGSRFFIQMLRDTNLTYAYHTIGACMVCRVDIYCEVGGMNTLFENEDFQFMHKLIAFGGHCELNSTKVKIQYNPLKGGIGYYVIDEKIYSHDKQVFWDIADVFHQLLEIYEGHSFTKALSTPMANYMDSINAESILIKMISSSVDFPSFEKYFRSWFDVNRLLDYLEYSREYYSLTPIEALCEQDALIDKSINDKLSYYRMLK